MYPGAAALGHDLVAITGPKNSHEQLASSVVLLVLVFLIPIYSPFLLSLAHLK